MAASQHRRGDVDAGDVCARAAGEGERDAGGPGRNIENPARCTLFERPFWPSDNSSSRKS